MRQGMNVLTEFKRNIQAGTLAHAYIVEVEPGAYRDELLRQMAEELFVQSVEIEDPDERKKEIRAVEETVRNRSHQDLVYMHQSGKTTYKTEEDAIPFLQKLSLRSCGKYRMGIIEKGELLSNTVQNKILKSLEEPPEGTVILIALDNRDKLLPTVRSRCVVLRDSGTDKSAFPEDQEWLEIWNQKYFFRYRKMINEKIRDMDTANQFLDALERSARAEGRIEAVLRIEETRKDMYMGMNREKALKRVFLQLKK